MIKIRCEKSNGNLLVLEIISEESRKEREEKLGSKTEEDFIE